MQFNWRKVAAKLEYQRAPTSNHYDLQGMQIPTTFNNLEKGAEVRSGD
jgi:hypothetical protein